MANSTFLASKIQILSDKFIEDGELIESTDESERMSVASSTSSRLSKHSIRSTKNGSKFNGSPLKRSSSNNYNGNATEDNEADSNSDGGQCVNGIEYKRKKSAENVLIPFKVDFIENKRKNVPSTQINCADDEENWDDEENDDNIKANINPFSDIAEFSADENKSNVGRSNKVNNFDCKDTSGYSLSNSNGNANGNKFKRTLTTGNPFSDMNFSDSNNCGKQNSWDSNGNKFNRSKKTVNPVSDTNKSNVYKNMSGPWNNNRNANGNAFKRQQTSGNSFSDTNFSDNSNVCKNISGKVGNWGSNRNTNGNIKFKQNQTVGNSFDNANRSNCSNVSNTDDNWDSDGNDDDCSVKINNSNLCNRENDNKRNQSVVNPFSDMNFSNDNKPNVCQNISIKNNNWANKGNANGNQNAGNSCYNKNQLKVVNKSNVNDDGDNWDSDDNETDKSIPKAINPFEDMDFSIDVKPPNNYKSWNNNGNKNDNFKAAQRKSPVEGSNYTTSTANDNWDSDGNDGDCSVKVNNSNSCHRVTNNNRNQSGGKPFSDMNFSNENKPNSSQNISAKKNNWDNGANANGKQNAGNSLCNQNQLKVVNKTINISNDDGDNWDSDDNDVEKSIPKTINPFEDMDFSADVKPSKKCNSRNNNENTNFKTAQNTSNHNISEIKNNRDDDGNDNKQRSDRDSIPKASIPKTSNKNDDEDNWDSDEEEHDDSTDFKRKSAGNPFENMDILEDASKSVSQKNSDNGSDWDSNHNTDRSFSKNNSCPVDVFKNEGEFDKEISKKLPEFDDYYDENEMLYVRGNSPPPRPVIIATYDSASSDGSIHSVKGNYTKTWKNQTKNYNQSFQANFGNKNRNNMNGPRLQLCKFYALGNCFKGDDCIFMHSAFPCKYYYLGFEHPENADKCKFLHGDPLSHQLRDALLNHLERAPSTILGDFPRMDKQKYLELFNSQNDKLTNSGRESSEINWKTSSSMREGLNPPARWSNSSSNECLNPSNNNNNGDIEKLLGVLSQQQIDSLIANGTTRLEQLTVFQLNQFGLKISQILELQQKTLTSVLIQNEHPTVLYDDPNNIFNDTKAINNKTHNKVQNSFSRNDRLSDNENPFQNTKTSLNNNNENFCRSSSNHFSNSLSNCSAIKDNDLMLFPPPIPVPSMQHDVNTTDEDSSLFPATAIISDVDHRFDYVKFIGKLTANSTVTNSAFSCISDDIVEESILQLDESFIFPNTEKYKAKSAEMDTSFQKLKNKYLKANQMHEKMRLKLLPPSIPQPLLTPPSFDPLLFPTTIINKIDISSIVSEYLKCDKEYEINDNKMLNTIGQNPTNESNGDCKIEIAGPDVDADPNIPSDHQLLMYSNNRDPRKKH